MDPDVPGIERGEVPFVAFPSGPGPGEGGPPNHPGGPSGSRGRARRYRRPFFGFDWGFALAVVFVSASARTAGASSRNSPASYSRAAASTSPSGSVFEVNSP